MLPGKLLQITLKRTKKKKHYDIYEKWSDGEIQWLIATVGHGWARAHPTSARVGRKICTNAKSFLKE